MESLSNYFSKLLKSDTSSDELMKGTVVKKLEPDSDAGNPNKAWKKRLKHCTCTPVQPMDPSTPVKKDHVRFVCISDTHTRVEKNQSLDIPGGDVLLHAGDFSMFGLPDEVDLFNKYLGKLPHKHKVVIAGNHDNSFDLDLLEKKRSTRIWTLDEDNYDTRLEYFGVENVHEMLTECIYLQDSMIEIYGIKIYGSPWTPGNGSWGFQRPRGPGLMKKWNQIPTDTDILLTHCPPCGYGDNIHADVRHRWKSLAGSLLADHVGCVDLLNTVQKRVRPKYHVFGHIHEGYGVTTDGTTTYINASTCTASYAPKNPTIVFDLPLPPGYTKVDDVDNIQQNDVDICDRSSDNKANCDKEAVRSKSSYYNSDIIDYNEENEKNDESDDDEVEEESDDTGSTSSNSKADTARTGEKTNDVKNTGVEKNEEKGLKLDEDNKDDIFSHCSHYSEGNSFSASNKDGMGSSDEDSDIVFDSELELDFCNKTLR